MKKTIIGFILMIISIILVITETNHFGNNILPKTIGEMVCDLIILILFAIGVSLIDNDKKIL